MPASGWAAVSAGSELRSGAASNALCTRISPVTPSTITAYGSQPVVSAAQPPCSRSCPLTRVRASWSPYSRPAPSARSAGPTVSRVRLAQTVRTMAVPATTPMISQCRSSFTDAAPGFGWPARMKAATPPASSARPPQPCRPSGCPVWCRESAMAKSRFVASSGSTSEISPWPSARAPSTMPQTISAMPPSQSGTRTRSSSSRKERKSFMGACLAALCWSTNPNPRQQAAATESATTSTDT